MSSVRRLRLRLRLCECVLRRLICSQDWHVSSCSPLIKALSSLTNLLFWLETSSSDEEVGRGSYLKSRKLLRTSRSINFSYPMANLSSATLWSGYTNQVISSLILEFTETLKRLVKAGASSSCSWPRTEIEGSPTIQVTPGPKSGPGRHVSSWSVPLIKLLIWSQSQLLDDT